MIQDPPDHNSKENQPDLASLKTELSRHGIFTTTFEDIYNWGRKNSVWPLTFGLACCAIEMIATTMARYDLARFERRGLSPIPEASGSHHRLRHRDQENGAAHRSAV